MPRLFFSVTLEPTGNSRGSWTAAPCRFRLVAFALIVDEAFWRSSPVNPTDACNAIRVLRRFPSPLPTSWELWTADPEWCWCIGVTGTTLGQPHTPQQRT